MKVQILVLSIIVFCTSSMCGRANLENNSYIYLFHNCCRLGTSEVVSVKNSSGRFCRLETGLLDNAFINFLFS
jgi:hypothetical protein